MNQTEIKKILTEITINHPNFGACTTWDKLKEKFDHPTLVALSKDLGGQTMGWDEKENVGLIYMCDIERFFFGGMWD
jgi:hypothetical protein